MKKIINAPDAVIEDYITGLVAGSQHLARVAGWPVVVRAAAQRGSAEQVALVSGGGSGHEPAHAGYVGEGMLDAAVLGPVFTSPSVDAVYAAIVSVATPAGVVLIVKNYTGDRLNFGLAAELARAEGIRVEMIVVADDAALGDTSRAGRRGLSATVLVHKVAGAAAARGWPIERVVAVATRMSEAAATMGVGLGSCLVPGAAAPNFDLGEAELEWGLGIHGEAGSERGPAVPSAEIAARLVGVAAGELDLVAGDDVVAMVNGLGGTPDLELRILQGDVLRELRERGVRVRMSWAAPFLTSLEMPGASVTLARVDTELLELLGATAQTAAFPHATPVLDAERVLTVPGPQTFGIAAGPGGVPGIAKLSDSVASVARAVDAAEPMLTELDRIVGDGDLGINLSRGARALENALPLLASQATAERLCAAVADVLRHEVGGTSGPLYSLLWLSISERLRGVRDPDASDWAAAFAAGVARVRTTGGAAPGDSTMVDALQPAADALLGALAHDPADAGAALAAAASAARRGADATAELTPSLGRSSYVGDRAVGIPDPGAVAVAMQFEALLAVFAEESHA